MISKIILGFLIYTFGFLTSSITTYLYLNNDKNAKIKSTLISIFFGVASGIILVYLLKNCK